MFVTRKKVEAIIERTKAWVRLYVADAIDNHSMSSRAPSSKCGCPGCVAWRNSSEVIMQAAWESTPRPESTTPNCWGKRIADLEGKLAALLQHQGVKVNHIPEAKTEAHWAVNPVLVREEPIKRRPSNSARKRR